VVTQPDRPRGRDRRPAPPPVKEWALECGLEVAQPASVRAPEFAAWLEGIRPDVVVTCAYGRILPPAVLAVPRLGCINVHFSLLPRYRGAAPVQWALINGDAATGVTIMHMDATMDTGDIILQDRVAIAAADDGATLGERLASRGAALLVSALDLLARCEAPRRPQDCALATLAPPLDRADERIDWQEPAGRIAGLVRALSPAPGACTARGGGALKVWRGQAEDPPVSAPAAPAAPAGPAAPPGTVLAAGDAGIVVACGAGAYRIVEVQAAGGRRMAAGDYLRGRPLPPGERLG
jgi:methionyl-tRNA formyltransferase